jgi:uncharacterized protein GlcG (DUF336 family)
MLKQLIVFAAATGLAAGGAAAQSIDKFVVSSDAAAKTLNKNDISADTAAKIAQACIDFATQNKIAVSIFIIDPNGDIVHAHRMDGQNPINIETGLLKAKSALYTKDSTHLRANMVANNMALQLRWSTLPIFPVSGGLPIVVDKQLIGAIGVGGSNMDEECAYAALTKVIGPQPPLEPKSPPANRPAAR